MKKKKPKNKLSKLRKALRRIEAGQAGYYDGRFKEKVEKGKKYKDVKHKGRKDDEGMED
jgi:hypothetical protein